jgi:hypothetical protein
MKTIIINGQRELAELPELWYTDGTDEANEWKLNASTWPPKLRIGNSTFVARGRNQPSNGADSNEYFEDGGYTYITPSEFLRLVYEPWKESQNVKLPTTYEEVCDLLDFKSTLSYHHIPHINACIQLTNIMNFANDAFEGDGKEWEIYQDGRPEAFPQAMYTHPIRFTSKAAAEWAYKAFPEIFKAYWNV